MNTPTLPRLVSLDAFRGFIMVAMASSGLGLTGVAAWFAADTFWHPLAYQFDHVAWRGCAFWDLIQPAFMFMVGVAMPYSHASRVAKGQTTAQIWYHVLVRSLILIGLAVFLSSNWGKQTTFIFVNVLAQIGLGYAFVHLFIGRGIGVQLAALAAILVGYWLYFALWPVPDPMIPTQHGLPASWEPFTGFFAHWNKNVNAAAAFDQWFLNLFPRETTFVYNSGGYQTLNFVPSMATMLLGLLAGEMLRSELAPWRKLLRLVDWGMVCVVLGVLADATICPAVKRIWTPSWALYSTGLCFWMLAGFYALIDLAGYQRWAFPLVIVGMNSIAMYVMSQLLKPWVRSTLRIHLGPDIFDTFGPQYATMVEALAFLGVLWAVCWWMYRQKIFIRI